MTDDPGRCTFVNGLCPDDLCVLTYGHPFTRRHRHITGSRYGSAYTTPEEQLEILRNQPQNSGWPNHESHYMAPRGTSDEDLIRLGGKLYRKLFPGQSRHQ